MGLWMAAWPSVSKQAETAAMLLCSSAAVLTRCGGEPTWAAMHSLLMAPSSFACKYWAATTRGDAIGCLVCAVAMGCLGKLRGPKTSTTWGCLGQGGRPLGPGSPGHEGGHHGQMKASTHSRTTCCTLLHQAQKCCQQYMG